MRTSAAACALLLVVALAATAVRGHSVAWCFGLDGQQNEILAIGSYHTSGECCWNTATTTISTTGSEPWAPSMAVTNYILESVSGTESSYFGCGYTCTYCSGYSDASIYTWQIKQFPAGTFTQGATYGIAQSSTEAVDTPLCAIPGGGATFPVLPPLGVESISCPSDRTGPSPAYPGCSSVVTYPAPTCTTSCPGSTCYGQRIAGPASGSSFPVGTTVVTHELYVDGLPTGKTCSFNVAVADTSAPFNTYCPPYQSFCGPAPHQFFWSAPSFADCSAFSQVDSHASGDSFGPGTTTVTSTATDASGNAQTCFFDLTLFSGPPVITCPGDFAVDDSDATPSTPGGPPTYYTANYAVSATDGCGDPLAYSQSQGVSGPPALIPYSALPHQFAYETDPDPVNGMTASCTFTVSLAASSSSAQITWVGQPSDRYRFGNGTANPDAKLAMYIDVRVCWEGSVRPSSSASLVIHDGTTTRHTFVTKDGGASVFPLDVASRCQTFLGPHGVNVGDFYLGMVSSTTLVTNNWLPFELVTMILEDWSA